MYSRTLEWLKVFSKSFPVSLVRSFSLQRNRRLARHGARWLFNTKDDGQVPIPLSIGLQESIRQASVATSESSGSHTLPIQMNYVHFFT